MVGEKTTACMDAREYQLGAHRRLDLVDMLLCSQLAKHYRCER